MRGDDAECPTCSARSGGHMDAPRTSNPCGAARLQPPAWSGLTLASHPAARRGLLPSVIGSIRLRVTLDRRSRARHRRDRPPACGRSRCSATRPSRRPRSPPAGSSRASARPPGSSCTTRPAAVPRSTARARSRSWATAERSPRRAWATAFAANRYLQFDMNAPLPGERRRLGRHVPPDRRERQPVGDRLRLRERAPHLRRRQRGDVREPGVAARLRHRDHARDAGAHAAGDHDHGRGERPPGPRLRPRQRRRGRR